MKFFKSRKEKILGLLDSEIYHRSMDALDLELSLNQCMHKAEVVDHKGLTAINKKLREVKDIREKIAKML